MMRTTITIDDSIASELMSISPGQSYAKAVQSAVLYYIQEQKRLRLIQLRGQIDIDPEILHLRELEISAEPQG